MIFRFLLTYWQILLVAAYLSTIQTIIYEKHFHILPSGDVVYHVHPFSNDAQKNCGGHTHVPGDLDDFQCNFLDFQEPAGLFTYNKSYVAPNNIKIEYSPIHLTSTIHRVISLRAPPVG